jgi:hypothetical protein
MSEAHRRLDAIEAGLEKLRGDDSAEQWRELRELFTSASTVNGALIGTLAAMAGTRRLPALLERSGELAHRVAIFCQENRFAVPQAKRILVRHIRGTDRRIIMRSLDTSDTACKYIWFWECNRP